MWLRIGFKQYNNKHELHVDKIIALYIVMNFGVVLLFKIFVKVELWTIFNCNVIPWHDNFKEWLNFNEENKSLVNTFSWN